MINMQQDDLKKGMMLGRKYPNDKFTWFLYLGGYTLLTIDGFEYLYKFTNDLRYLYATKAGYDFVAIATINFEKCKCIKDIFCTDNLNIIWERKDTLTGREASDYIYTLTGEKFNIKEDYVYGEGKPRH